MVTRLWHAGVFTSAQVPSVRPEAVCGPGWVGVDTGHVAACLQQLPGTWSWSQAADKCRDTGARLPDRRGHTSNYYYHP